MTTPMELPADVLVSIVLRFPPSSRRLTRLVCRQWRDVVDTRTAEMQSRAKPLVATAAGSAYVVDDLSTGSCRCFIKKNARPFEGTMVVGTCNGLICLCDNRRFGGAITLVNPVIAERLSLPLLSSTAGAPGRTYCVGWHEAYALGYHPITGRHKIVHVEAYARRGNLQQVKVFTMGEPSWRYVATGALPRCNYSAGVVAVDGTMYWAAKNGKKLMAFDLDRERLTFIKPLPDVSSDGWHLKEVRARLGILFFHSRARLGILFFHSRAQKTEVWVLEGAATMKKHKWNWLYIVGWDIPPHSSPTASHLNRNVVNKHKPSKDIGVAEINEKTREMLIIGRQTFTYVETREPLNVYKCWS